MDERTRFRASVLAANGARDQEIEDLLRYNESVFDRRGISRMEFPLPDEPFVSFWEVYIQEVQRAGSIEALGRFLVQLRFPVRDGISQDPGYVAATTLGAEPPAAIATGGKFVAPTECSVILYPTPAGRIPIITTAAREDFLHLVRALTRRNEPVAIPNSMGACMIAGYRNWDRIRRIKDQSDRKAGTVGSRNLQEAMQNKANYQDRFIILSSGYYSDIAPAQIGLPPDPWRRTSILIRREHECAHYFTRRVFSSMRNNLIDEIIADYCGIVAANGRFRADWMLMFLGLEDFPGYRAGGRLENYRGAPPLSLSAFQVLQRLVQKAAINLESADTAVRALCTGSHPLDAILPLSLLTLEELASSQAVQSLKEAFLSERVCLARPHSSHPGSDSV